MMPALFASWPSYEAYTCYAINQAPSWSATPAAHFGQSYLKVEKFRRSPAPDGFMRVVIRFGSRIRHPLFADWLATPAVEAMGKSAALSGTVSQLLDAAESGARATRVVYVVRNAERPFLSEGEREQVWRAFQVPVFAVFVGPRGRLLAYECEAQDGLHLAINCLAGAGWTAFFEDGERPSCTVMASVESATCECGRSGHRLLNPRKPAERATDPTVEFSRSA